MRELYSAQDQSGYELLMLSDPGIVSFVPNPSYEEYLRMHKVLVGCHGGRQLEAIYRDLRHEFLPRYLSTAGWAAAEAALARSDVPVEERVGLLHSGVECWRSALRNQNWLNRVGSEALVEHSAPYRIAMDIAVAPLLEGIIRGGTSLETRRRVFENCLGVAQVNATRMRLMKVAKDRAALVDHTGFAHECNALLAFNALLSEDWFAIPSTVRSDSGYYHREQTHDLSVVHQGEGFIKCIVPVEVKGGLKDRDYRRYRTMLVGGREHLASPEKYRPESTFAAIVAIHKGAATDAQRRLVEGVSSRLIGMVQEWYARGLGQLAAGRTPTVFHDSLDIAS